MRQAIHILRKDVRYLWIEIVAAMVAVGLFAFTASLPPLGWSAPLPRTVAAFLVQFQLPLAWWILITRAVHAEPLIGDRQFWTTRPYAWRSLLAAKALFCVLFVNLPMFLAQAIVVQAHGFSAIAQLPGLLWSQLLLTLVLILPIAAIAAVTTSVVQFLVLGLVAFVLALLLSLRFMLFASMIVGAGWGPMEWILTYYTLLIVAIAAPAVLMWQYAKRRTLLVRALAAATILLIVLGAPFSWTTAFAMQSRLSRHPVNSSAIRAGVNPSFQWMIRVLVERDGRVSLHIPLQVSGVDDDLQVLPEGLGLTLEGPNGTIWSVEAEHRANVTNTGQLIALETVVPPSVYQKVKDQPVKLRGSLYLTLYGDRQVSKVPFTNRPVPVRGMGLCSASKVGSAPYFLVCDAVFRPQPERISVKFEDASRDTTNYEGRRDISYSPFPAQFGFDPVVPFTAYSVFRGRLDAVTITTLEPVAHIRAPLQIEGLKLADYEKKL